MLGFRRLSVESVAIHVARLLAILSIWSVVVALGMGYFFAPRGVEAQPTYYDLIGFGCAFAIAGTVAASVALAPGGKRKWGVEIVLAVALTMAATAVLAALALWVAPGPIRSRMDLWAFLRLRDDVLSWGEVIVKFLAPLGAGVGSVVGVIAGLLIVLARRRPRLATAISLGLLVTCASEPVQPILSGLVIYWGWVIRRLVGTWPMTDDQVWATATVLGAIAGAVVACLATHISRRHRSRSVPRTAGPIGPVFPLAPRSNGERGRRPIEESVSRIVTQSPPD